MVIKVIKSTDAHFIGSVYSGATLDEAIMPLIKAVGDFMDIEIIGDKLVMKNSNYLLIARIINK